MGPTGSMAAFSSELDHGFTAVAAFTVMLTIATTRTTDTPDRPQIAEIVRSITSKRTRRATGKGIRAKQHMMAEASTELVRKAAVVEVGTEADMVISIEILIFVHPASNTDANRQAVAK
jgi:hypothetical protein